MHMLMTHTTALGCPAVGRGRVAQRIRLTRHMEAASVVVVCACGGVRRTPSARRHKRSTVQCHIAFRHEVEAGSRCNSVTRQKGFTVQFRHEAERGSRCIPSRGR